MSLFADDAQHSPLPAGTTRGRRRGAGPFGWLVLVLSLLILGVLAAAPAPYVIEQPGPVFNVLGKVQGESGKVPLIKVGDAETFKTSGSLDMLTVQLVGNPQQSPGWLDIVSAWFDPSRAVMPMDLYYPPGVTTEQRNQQNTADMVNSQQDAVAAALRELGHEVPEHVIVGEIAEGAPAEGHLRLKDEIVSVNGTTVTSLASLRSAIQDNGADQAAGFGIIRDGKPKTVEVKPVSSTAADGSKSVVVGIATSITYDFPIDISIQLDNVGGPSAGMMFSLGMIDKLTPGALTGGENVAGTGTIDASGNVGPIGGIRQKMFGAKDAGARWFLAPVKNCDEVTGHIPDGLTVFSVSTLDDALAALDVISEDGDTSKLPTCPAG